MPLPEEETAITLARHWAVLCRRRWWIIAVLAAVWGVAWAATWVLPARYTSRTTILIEEAQVPEHYVQPNVSSDVQERLQRLTEQILSRARLRQIILDLDLYAVERRRMGADDLVWQMRRQVKVEPIRSAGQHAGLAAFTVSFTGHSPALAQQVASRLMSLFIDENLRRREKQSEQAAQFLQAQLAQARARIEQQETRLREFKAQYLGQLPSQVSANVAVLESLNARLANAKEALNRAEQQKLYLNSLLRQYRDMQALPSGNASAPPASTPPALDSELSRLQMQLAELQTRDTAGHPDVIALRGKIARTEGLRRQMERELAAGKAVVTSVAPSPAIAQIISQLQANGLEIANRKQAIAAADRDIQRMQARLNNAPLREQQLADLTRDYDQLRAYYESLLAKKDQVQLAANLESQQQGERFSVLEPPALPVNPDFPNRFKFSVAGLALGMALGVGAAYGREIMDDHIHSAQQVQALTGGAVLVSIPPVRTDRQLRWKWLRVGAEILCCLLLLAAVAGGTLLAFLADQRG